MSQNDETKKPVIECKPNGPYLVRGLKALTELRDGTQHETGEVVALCRCGASANKPFCDGSHGRVGFSDEKQAGRSADKRESYQGKGVTIHVNRAICAHAGFCTSSLPSVFRVKSEPFVDASGAAADAIIEAVKRRAWTKTVPSIPHSARIGARSLGRKSRANPSMPSPIHGNSDAS